MANESTAGDASLKDPSLVVTQLNDKAAKMGTGGMIQPFWGEMLVSPSALEWSLNYCSHACAYCFANLNSPTRKGDASKALRQVAEIGKRSTLTDLYLRNKYPVCVANKSDPFSESNYRETVPVLNMLKEHGVPLQFQTKGGKGIDDVLEDLPPSVWYITVCQHDDAVRKRIEPNAPSLDERLDLIAELTEMGHRVVVGVNPAVPEWMASPDTLMRLVSEAGATGAWIERLHLSKKQIQFMPTATQRNIGLHVIERAFENRDIPEEDELFIYECRQAAEGYGMDAYTFSYPAASDFFKPWREVYANTHPTNQDVANVFWSIEGFDETQLISFDDYMTVLEASASPYFKGKQRIGDYMRVVSLRTIENISNWSDHLTFRQLLWFAWSNPGNKMSLSSHGNFAAAVVKDKDGNDELLTDDKGAPYYVFSRGGINGRYVDYTGKLFER